MDDNPFQSPEVLAEASPASVARRDSRTYLVGEAVVFWEKLRWLYNVLLFTFAVLVAALMQGFGSAEVWLEILAGGLLANLCFGAGPLVSAYLAWFGIRAKALDLFLFACGTALTMVLAYMTIRW